MENNIDVILKLKSVKASLLKEIEKINSAIEALKPNDLALLDIFVNNETIGVYDFQLCETNAEKVKFAIIRLKQAAVDDITKFLIMLGEPALKAHLRTLVKQTVVKLLEDKIIMEQEVNDKIVYCMIKK